MDDIITNSLIRTRQKHGKTIVLLSVLVGKIDNFSTNEDNRSMEKPTFHKGVVGSRCSVLIDLRGCLHRILRLLTTGEVKTEEIDRSVDYVERVVRSNGKKEDDEHVKGKSNELEGMNLDSNFDPIKENASLEPSSVQKDYSKGVNFDMHFLTVVIYNCFRSTNERELKG